MAFSNTTIPIALSILFIAGLALGAGKPPNPADADTITVAIDLVRGESQAPVRIALSIAGPHGCAELADHSADNDHKFEVCREPSDSEAPILRFNIERRSGKENRAVRKFAVGAAAPFEKTIVIGRYEDGSAAPTEVRVRTTH